MVSSHNHTVKTRFIVQYWYVSVLLSIGLFVYSYWDIVKLRFLSGFFSGDTITDTTSQLFTQALQNNLLHGFQNMLPILTTALLASLVAYTFYSSYKFTIYDLDVHHNYINSEKVSTARIVGHYIAVYTASFVVPLLFWCLYFVVILPWLTKIPLNFIFGSSTTTFGVITIGCLMAIIVVTHTGILLTRLTSRILRKT